MTDYTLIESRDPFDSADVERFHELAASLANEGHTVTYYLVQNGVLLARPNVKSSALAALASNGITVLVDSFSLQERGIAADRLVPGVNAAQLDVVVDHLASGRKVIWH